MQGHDIIVIGSSAGGVKALTRLIGALPGDLEATLFVVQHLSANRQSDLPGILTDVGSLPASHPQHEERILRGRIYVAPPDHHLLLHDGRMSVVRGPHENLFRPSIDALFRSAARSQGPRVIGVVLTGALDDGTIGLQAIKSRGGITAVQDPREAEWPSMPRNALRYADPDYTLCLDQIPAFLMQMIAQPVIPSAAPVPREVDIETRIADQEIQGHDLLLSVDSLGTRSPFTCPTCQGVLWEIDSKPLRFRCHTGHAFSRDALLAAQTEALEESLWSSVRLLEERANLYRKIADHPGQEGDLLADYRNRAARLDQEALSIKRLLLTGTGLASEPAESPEPEPMVTSEIDAYR